MRSILHRHHQSHRHQSHRSYPSRYRLINQRWAAAEGRRPPLIWGRRSRPHNRCGSACSLWWARLGYVRGLDRSRGVWCGGLVLPRSDLRKQPFRLAGRGGIWRMTHFVELAKNGVVILAKNDIVIRQGLTFDILDKNHHVGDHNWLWLWLYPIRDSTK